jgi:hypothetical protein
MLHPKLLRFSRTNGTRIFTISYESRASVDQAGSLRRIAPGQHLQGPGIHRAAQKKGRRINSVICDITYIDYKGCENPSAIRLGGPTRAKKESKVTRWAAQLQR